MPAVISGCAALRQQASEVKFLTDSMIDKKYDEWQRQLLDFSKRNRLVKFPVSDSGLRMLDFIKPCFDELVNILINSDKKLIFQKPVDESYDAGMYSLLNLFEKLSSPIEVNIGDIKTNRSFKETNKVLKHMRSKSKLALEEKGANILYVVVGLVEWKDKDTLTSPLIMIPVSLEESKGKSTVKDYSLKKTGEEIVVNQTLQQLFYRTYKISLPDLDLQRCSVNDYINKVEKLIENRGWSVKRKVCLGLVDYNKISMYKDLERNEKLVKSNPIVRSFAGIPYSAPIVSLENADKMQASDCYQVVDADSSQQEAVYLSHWGVSFVMQGPPGTGKSQTITNIIAQALADGKKILFVSEKKAALDVVYKRLSEVKLADFCLSLHDPDANKKEIINDIGKNMELSSGRKKLDESCLSSVDHWKDVLEKYKNEIHTDISPIDKTIYEAYCEFVSRKGFQDFFLDIKSPAAFTVEELNKYLFAVEALDNSKSALGDKWYLNPWQDVTVKNVTYELVDRIKKSFSVISDYIKTLYKDLEESGKFDFDYDDFNVYLLNEFKKHLEICSKRVGVPLKWLDESSLNKKIETAKKLRNESSKIKKNSEYLASRYTDNYFKIEAAALIEEFENLHLSIENITGIYCKDNKKFFENVKRINDTLTDKPEFLEEFESEFSEIDSTYNLNFSTAVCDLENYYTLLEILASNVALPKECFSVEKLNGIRSSLDEYREKTALRNNLFTEINEKFDYSLIDYSPDKIEELCGIVNNPNKMYLYNKTYLELLQLTVKLSEAYNFINNAVEKTHSLSLEKFLDNGIELPEYISLIPDYMVLFDALKNDIHPSNKWKNEKKLSEIFDNIELCKGKKDLYLKLEKDLDNKKHSLYENALQFIEADFFDKEGNENFSKAFAAFNNAEVYKFLNLPVSAIKEFADSLSQQHKEFKSLANYNIFTASQKLARSGVPVFWYFNQIPSYLVLIDALRSDIKPSALWINSDKKKDFLDTVELCRTYAEEYNTCRNQVLQNWEEGIFEIDADSMLRRFKTEYTNVFKIFKSSYKNDIKLLRGYSREVGKKITEQEALELLTTLQKISEKKKWFAEHEAENFNILGKKYSGVSTDWERLVSDRKKFDAAYSLDFVGSRLMQIANDSTENDITQYEIAYEQFTNLYNKCNSSDYRDYFETHTIPEGISHIKTILDDVSSVIKVVDDLTPYLKNRSQLNLIDIITTILNMGLYFDLNGINLRESDINVVCNDLEEKYAAVCDLNAAFAGDYNTVMFYLQSVMELNKFFSDNDNLYSDMFGSKYIGILTDWDKLKSDINKFVSAYNLDFVKSKIYAIIEQSNEDDIETYSLAYDYYSYLFSKCTDSAVSEYFADSDIHSGIQKLYSEWQYFTAITELTNELLSFAKEKDSLLFGDCAGLINNLTFYSAAVNEIENLEFELSNILDNLFNKENTDFNRVYSDIATAEKLVQIFGVVPQVIIDLVCEDNENKVRYIPKYSKEQLSELLDSIRSFFPYSQEITVSELISKIKLLTDLSRKYLVNIDSLNSEAKNNFDVNDLFKDLQTLLSYQAELKQYNNSIENNYEIYKDTYDNYFNGAETDWKEISDRLKDIKILLGSFISVEFLKKLLVSKMYTDKILSDVNNIINDYNEIEWCCSLFGDNYNLIQSNLKKLGEKFDKWCANIDSLGAWVDYRDSKKTCLDLGLKAFVQDSEDKHYESGTLRDIFLKAFWHGWIKGVSNKSGCLSEFKASKQDNYVRNFCIFDKQQFSLAQDRIRRNLITSLPDYNKMTDKNSQVGILKHEMNKKQKHKPIRRLFREIPDLLLELKPCLMMSPISVSTFLEDNTYHFDMVIFDEASQIFPQDAIGSVFRGDQVIIAGDSKQLPPSNFFNGGSGSDEDEEEEYETLEESILESAALSIPNHSLLWHYRSRNEDLISFSNHEIYGDKLVTFPGNMTQKKDSGVEYVYVEDGIYENKTNRKEAQKCVELVKKHFDTYPNRSLGIIAFSEKQQSVIEDEIDKFRDDNPQYDKFFNENKEEPFFIKNLENVQGDERDTIIFSICYGKDRNGNMKMNFGPLSKAGGERRLNVAITRAKENVKLVGSITESDIDLKRAKSEGARILRNYIDYARHGSSVLSSKQAANGNNAADSIGDSIRDVLRKNGYETECNVGNSQYKIDVAVKNPYDKSSYVVGIECDGESYYNAKTVRDRERLRKEVLERMGWKMFRVWSAEWVNNYEGEKKRLLDFVKSEVDKLPKPSHKSAPQKVNPAPKNAALQKSSYNRNNQSVPTSRPYVPQAPLPETPKPKAPKPSVAAANSQHRDNAMTDVFYDKKYEFAYYQKAKITPKSDFSEGDVNKWIYMIINAEQPVHVDVIRERIAEIIGENPDSQKVRDYVETGLRKNKNLIKTDKKEDRFYLTGATKKVNVRIPHNGKGFRNIEHISEREISLAIYTIVCSKKSIWIVDLMREVCGVFGFSSNNRDFKQKFNQALMQLKRENNIRIKGDYVLPK